jgi:hypothetical protein
MSVTVDRPGGDGASALRPLDALIAKRREAGGPGGTGVLVLCSYDAFTRSPRPDDGARSIVTMEADGVITFPDASPPVALGDPGLVARATAALDRRARDLPGQSPVRISARRLCSGGAASAGASASA